MCEAGKSWNELIYGDTVNAGYLFFGYQAAMTRARKRTPTQSGVPEILESLAPVIEKNHKGQIPDRLRKIFENNPPESMNTDKLIKALDKSLIEDIKQNESEIKDHLKICNIRFNQSVSDSFKNHDNPPNGAWFNVYMNAYIINSLPEREHRDSLCRFLLKLADQEVSYLRNPGNNRVSSLVHELLSLHGHPAQNVNEENIDRLMLWAALDDLQIDKYWSSTDNTNGHMYKIISLEKCIPKNVSGNFISSVNCFLDCAMEKNYDETKKELALALGVDVRTLARIRNHEALLEENSLYEYYAIE